ncbi:MAG TPA: Flp pilus assembly protein CpaB [Allosphingosinicella sp.]|jgi:pilus assembly protein CpaB|uniref:Flp pilus assembly protein CpaB n=1 Tax=Allosphingosinicella sp. TaxID=2823234 RepID=UPI002F28CD8B
MDVRKIVLLVGALIIAAVTAVMAKNMFVGASAPEAAAAPVPLGPEVLVATRSLPVGTIIDAESIRFQPWPKELVEKAYYLKGQPGANAADLLGTVVRNEISAGQPVTQGSMIRPGERGFLAAALGPGMRAVTVAVSTISGVAGFVFPGDRVDVILTQEVAGGEGQPLRAAETILRNLRVLAVDQRTNTIGEDGKPVVQSSATVTLEATPRIAEKIQVAQMVGSLTLALRSIADTTAELERAVASGEVNVPNDPVAERRMLLEIAAKPSDNGGTFSVGADVSRFQRSSVPRRAGPKPDARETEIKAMGSMIGAIAAASGTARPAPAETTVQVTRPTGPTVRVSRGNTVTIVPVGAK